MSSADTEEPVTTKDKDVVFCETTDQDPSVAVTDELGQISIFSAAFDTPVSPKATLDGLWLPLFALSKNATDIFTSEFTDNQGNGFLLEITPATGQSRANLFDKEVLVWLTGAIRKALDEGTRPTRRIQFRAASFLTDSGRGLSGASYSRLKGALDRLKDTSFKQHLIVDSKSQGSTRNIGFISAVEYRQIDKNGSIVEVILSDHFFASILNNKGVLAMDKQYFSFRKSYTRRLYEIARKAVGNQKRIIEFREHTLMQRMGAQCAPTDFRRLMNEAIEEGIPGYVINMVGEGRSPRRYQFLPESKYLEIMHSEMEAEDGDW
ncbi:replication initiator protein A [Alcanivorax sp. 1008]|uniref:replication initiator protein A n=1 Tax=Alcanivorax sp. 1008 TaxID=2816853 RepID=UPI001DA589DF|nr:replication initiator protein A [Alcanivorax sp. 1008]MCC1496893.1 replication initiator protein A [Alcanivorax sp. 1008]